MDADAVFVARALSAIIGTLVMGLFASYPIALAPGMGINAFFAFTVFIGAGIPWETALSAVLVSGILFLILSLSVVREKIINGIPATYYLAVASGIGLLIVFFGFHIAYFIIGDPET